MNTPNHLFGLQIPQPTAPMNRAMAIGGKEQPWTSRYVSSWKCQRPFSRLALLKISRELLVVWWFNASVEGEVVGPILAKNAAQVF